MPAWASIRDCLLVEDALHPWSGRSTYFLTNFRLHLDVDLNVIVLVVVGGFDEGRRRVRGEREVDWRSHSGGRLKHLFVILSLFLC